MHDHHHHHADGHHHPHDHDHRRDRGISGYGLAPTRGHNAAAQVAQWQEPHRHGEPVADSPEPDFDLVEATFAETFPKATDPTSFLRLAGIPFVGNGADGAALHLLRVEFEEMTDVAAVTPHLGGKSVRIAPLPAQMVSRRRRLRFVYQREAEVVRLSLAEARSLASAVPDRG